MPLTEVQIKRLKPRAGRYAVSDGRGLALEVMPTGVASWRYRYQFKGKTEKVSLGQYTVVDRRVARCTCLWSDPHRSVGCKGSG